MKNYKLWFCLFLLSLCGTLVSMSFSIEIANRFTESNARTARGAYFSGCFIASKNQECKTKADSYAEEYKNFINTILGEK